MRPHGRDGRASRSRMSSINCRWSAGSRPTPAPNRSSKTGLRSAPRPVVGTQSTARLSGLERPAQKPSSLRPTATRSPRRGNRSHRSMGRPNNAKSKASDRSCGPQITIRLDIRGMNWTNARSRSRRRRAASSAGSAPAPSTYCTRRTRSARCPRIRTRKAGADWSPA